LADEEKEEKEEKEPEGEVEGEEGSVKKNKFGLDKKTLIIIGIILIIMPILAYFLVAFIINPAVTSEDDRLRKMISIGDIYNLEEISINLQGSEAKKVFISKIGLEINRKELAFELNLRKIQFKDILIDILRGKSFDDFKDPIIKNKLKREILDRFNSELETGEIVNVFFDKFLLEVKD